MENKLSIKDILSKCNLKEEEIKDIETGIFYCNKKISDLSIDELLYIDMVRRHPIYLKNIKNQTSLICEEAVKNFGYALEYVNEQTERLAYFAVSQNGLALEHVNAELHTDKIIETAIKQNPLAFKYSARKTKNL